MRHASGFAALLALLPLAPHPHAGEAPRPVAAIARPMKIDPPVAVRRPVELSVHGIVRVDDYAWLRDPSWREVIRKPSVLKREIRAHIEAENRYAQAVLAPLASPMCTTG